MSLPRRAARPSTSHVLQSHLIILSWFNDTQMPPETLYLYSGSIFLDKLFQVPHCTRKRMSSPTFMAAKNLSYFSRNYG